MNSDKKAKNKTKVQYIHVIDEYSNQRIDNFLINYLKNVPKSHIYRLLRKGDIRVNKRRIKAFYRILTGDTIKLPPLFLEEMATEALPSQHTMQLLAKRILYEDDHVLVINKPSGLSVHAGSTVRIGVIEVIRHLYPQFPHIELAHRLDSETSGCLILAKKRRILREIHELLREGKITKLYWALTQGKWKESERRVHLPLLKDYRDGGKHVVEVHPTGKQAISEFHPIQEYQYSTLVEVKLLTGRTHQIRVHAAHLQHPIAGDDRYGDVKFNQNMHQLGLKRLFLHARLIDFTLPSLNQRITVVAPLDPELTLFLKKHEHEI
ncbi:MAG: hypothetical protein A3F42_04785 [Gammaproteobacteria bacterium RIFCSPHIGHO2_12_FULL_37_34]|nr:MAG: hypothetical protein A3F42_04785 [Gammaproteobacteria bacterium RIFCSPHIGHO2_12_FULL_37_34]